MDILDENSQRHPFPSITKIDFASNSSAGMYVGYECVNAERYDDVVDDVEDLSEENSYNEDPSFSPWSRSNGWYRVQVGRGCMKAIRRKVQEMHTYHTERDTHKLQKFGLVNLC